MIKAKMTYLNARVIISTCTPIIEKHTGKSNVQIIRNECESLIREKFPQYSHILYKDLINRAHKCIFKKVYRDIK